MAFSRVMFETMLLSIFSAVKSSLLAGNSAKSMNSLASGSLAYKSFLNESDQTSKLSLGLEEGISFYLRRSVLRMRDSKSRE